METNLPIDEIDIIHQKANAAFEKKDIALFMNHFANEMQYINADATNYDRHELVYQTEKYFKKTKNISTTYYRLKSAMDGELFTEKIARKSIVFLKGLLFAKKQTIQTEEFFTWKKIADHWKIISVTVTLEEKY